MSLHTFSDGDVLEASQLNDSFDVAFYRGALKSLQPLSESSDLIMPNDTILNTFTSEDSNSIDTSNTAACWSSVSNEYVAGGAIFDNIDDSSVDATLWSTSGTVTEDTDKITVSDSPATLTSDGASGLNMNSGTTYVIMDLQTTDAGAGSGYIEITNGTTTVTVYTIPNPMARTVVILEVNATTNLVSVWLRTSSNTWNQVATDVDISAVTTNKYLRLRSDAVQYDVLLYKICSYTSDVKSYIITSSKTLPSTSTKVITWHDANNGDGQATLNGTDWATEASTDIIDLTSYSGTSFKLRAAINTNGSETPDVIKYLCGVAY